MGFPRQGPKEWSPKRIEKILEGLDDLTVDTEVLDGSRDPRLVGVAVAALGGKLTAYYVTDDPEPARRAIERGDLSGLESYASRGCRGLELTLNPQLWKRRTWKRWDVLETLSEDKRGWLADLIEQNLREHKISGYISTRELARAMEHVAAWRETGDPEHLQMVSLQPYNIDVPGLVVRFQIAEPWEPYAVPVIFEGRFLEYTQEVQQWSMEIVKHYRGKKADFDPDVFENLGMEDLCRVWQELGWDGIFTTGRRMGSENSITIWNAKSIRKFGSDDESLRLSGRGQSRGEGGIVQVGRRFETALDPDSRVADIHERAKKSIMFSLLPEHAVVELRDLVDQLRSGVVPEQGRFKADLTKELPEIVDTQVYRRFRELTPEDLGELLFLLDELLRQMEARSS